MCHKDEVCPQEAQGKNELAQGEIVLLILILWYEQTLNALGKSGGKSYVGRRRSHTPEGQGLRDTQASAYQLIKKFKPEIVLFIATHRYTPHLWGLCTQVVGQPQMFFWRRPLPFFFFFFNEFFSYYSHLKLQSHSPRRVLPEFASQCVLSCFIFDNKLTNYYSYFFLSCAISS